MSAIDSTIEDAWRAMRPFVEELLQLTVKLAAARPGNGLLRQDAERALFLHRMRHRLLHAQFDELLADFLLHNENAHLADTPIATLMDWSGRQISQPDELKRAEPPTPTQWQKVLGLFGG